LHRAVETFGIQGSDLAIITNGTLAGTVKAYIRDRGLVEGVGLIKMNLFRPFPKAELRKAVKGLKQLVVIDRNLSPGCGGILVQEIRASLYGVDDSVSVVSVIGGLGGVDVTPEHLGRLVDKVRQLRGMTTDTIWMEA
jgi:pyruvate/2-oxoacid:ferredoxin oxidoreductase alpha subunit